MVKRYTRRYKKAPTRRSQRSFKKAPQRRSYLKRYTRRPQRSYRKKRFSKGMFGVAYEVFPGILHRFSPIGGSENSQMSNWSFAKIDVSAMINQLAFAHAFNVQDIVWFKLKIWNKISKTFPKGYLMQLGPSMLLKETSHLTAQGGVTTEGNVNSSFAKKIQVAGLTKTMKDYGMPLLLDPLTIFRRIGSDKNASNYKGLADYAALYIFHSQSDASLTDIFDFSLTVKFKKSVHLKIPNMEEEYISASDLFVKQTTIDYFHQQQKNHFGYYTRIATDAKIDPKDMISIDKFDEALGASAMDPLGFKARKDQVYEDILKKKPLDEKTSNNLGYVLDFFRRLQFDNMWSIILILTFEAIGGTHSGFAEFVKLAMKIMKVLATWKGF